MAESETFVRFEGVVAGYGGGDVLKGVDFDVPRGGVTCIVGPNGSGKSTLLKTVSGLLRPRLGEIKFKGQSLVGLTHARSCGWASCRCRRITASFVRCRCN
jgi:ABC-type branched-subunit amino acid transport system ATPase component